MLQVNTATLPGRSRSVQDDRLDAAGGDTGAPARASSLRRRTCVGCRREAFAGDRLRLTHDDQHGLKADSSGSVPGRGAWLHPLPGCLRAAARGGLARAFKRPIAVAPEPLLALVQSAGVEQVLCRLEVARRRGSLLCGELEVRRAVAEDRALLVVVTLERGPAWMASVGVNRARYVCFGTKELFSGVARGVNAEVLAVTEPKLAQAVESAVRVARLTLEPVEAPTRAVASRNTLEVR